MVACRFFTFLISLTVMQLTCSNQVADPDQERIVLTGEIFDLAVADDFFERNQGLMGVQEIERNGGMIFIFPDIEIRNFWMGHCITDMDIVFLDGRGRVTAIHTMKAQDPKFDHESDSQYRNRLGTYSSRFPAQFAIELAPGRAAELGLTFNDRLDIDLDHLKSRVR